MPSTPGQKPQVIELDKPLDKPLNIDVTPEGRQLNLKMPPNCELGFIEMDLEADRAFVLLIDSKESPAAVSSDLGPEWHNKDIRWLMADWGRECPVVGLEIKTAPTDAKARVKVFYNGVWLPLTPTEILDFSQNSHQSIPPVFGARVMLEFVTESDTPGLWDPLPVKADHLVVYGSVIPYDLQISIASEAPFFSQTGVLQEAALKIAGFEDAINRHITETGENDVPLKLFSRMPARINIKNFRAKTISVAQKLENLDEEGRLLLPWDQKEFAAALTIGAKAIVDEVQFEYAADLVPERSLIAPVSSETGKASLVGNGYDAAQGFAAIGDNVALAGLDLHLRPIRMPAKASLSLFPDEMDQPGRQPYPGAFAEVELSEDQSRDPWSPLWVSFQFPQPVPAPDSSWWAVVQVESGELHWYLSDLQVNMQKLTGLMYRTGGGSWLKRVSAESGSALIGQLRLRMPMTDKPEPSLTLKRDTESIPLKPEAGGSVQVTQKDLEAINKFSGADLKFCVQSESAGSVQFANLCIRYRTEEQQ